ncbi:hypothetical protein JYK14_20650 [Siccirubricoccus sp. KC 17139]|uniref:Lipoprotein n=1 Tax=Siccirubricoccus soli TaxID=2899147 RepID=A0ABT1D9F4_9PROT|nr:hypothetical protein [Siccirubricoccus soli]MCO6418554.1 hypothetical protein [Siccirubricoccus soli]MCP2684689.1 hypothetical protein [Siccirubricoccus soli]
MQPTKLLLGLAAGLALSACTQVTAPSGPPPAGAAAGPGAPAIQQQVRDIGGSSPNASAGVPSVTGSSGGADGRGGGPSITYSGPASSGVGGTGIPPTPQPRVHGN